MENYLLQLPTHEHTVTLLLLTLTHTHYEIHTLYNLILYETLASHTCCYEVNETQAITHATSLQHNPTLAEAEKHCLWLPLRRHQGSE